VKERVLAKNVRLGAKAEHNALYEKSNVSCEGPIFINVGA